MYVKAFIVNVNKRLKPFFLEQHINIVNRVTLQSFWFIFFLVVVINSMGTLDLAVLFTPFTPNRQNKNQVHRNTCADVRQSTPSSEVV